MNPIELLGIVDTLERIVITLAKELISNLWVLLLKWLEKVLRILNADVSILYAGFKLYVKKAANACRRLIRAYYQKQGQWYVREREDSVSASSVPDEIRNILSEDEADATSILQNELR